MSPDDRYDVSGLTEVQFEAGSNGQVLKNLLGITSSADDGYCRGFCFGEGYGQPGQNVR